MQMAEGLRYCACRHRCTCCCVGCIWAGVATTAPAAVWGACGPVFYFALFPLGGTRLQATCDFCNEPYTFSEESIVEVIEVREREQRALASVSSD